MLANFQGKYYFKKLLLIKFYFQNSDNYTARNTYMAKRARIVILKYVISRTLYILRIFLLSPWNIEVMFHETDAMKMVGYRFVSDSGASYTGYFVTLWENLKWTERVFFIRLFYHGNCSYPCSLVRLGRFLAITRERRNRVYMTVHKVLGLDFFSGKL